MSSSTRPRRTWGVVIRLVIAAGALGLTLHLAARVGWQDLGQRLAEARPGPLWLAVAILAGRWVTWSARWRLALARVSAPRSPVRTLLIVLASVLVNLITPWLRLLGGLSRARWAWRGGGEPFPAILSTVLFDQLLHHLSMTAFTWIALVAMALLLGQTALAAAVVVGGVAAAAGLWWWARRSEAGQDHPVVAFLARRAAARDDRGGTLWAHGRDAARLIGRLLADRRLVAGALGFSVLFLLLSVAGQWLLFVALERPVGPWVVLAALALGNAAGVLSGTPGGLGTTEAAMIACFVALGVERGDAVAGTLMFRGLHYVMVVALGLPPLLWLELAGGGRGRPPGGEVG